MNAVRPPPVFEGTIRFFDISAYVRSRPWEHSALRQFLAGRSIRKRSWNHGRHGWARIFNHIQNCGQSSRS